MVKRQPLRLAYHVKASGGTYDYVKTDQVPTGELWRIEHVAYENETGARGTFRRYTEKAGESVLLGEVQGPGAAELLHSDDKIWMVPGECMTIRQATCTANDVLSLYVHGYRVKSEFIPEEGE